MRLICCMAKRRHRACHCMQEYYIQTRAVLDLFIGIYFGPIKCIINYYVFLCFTGGR